MKKMMSKVFISLVMLIGMMVMVMPMNVLASENTMAEKKGEGTYSITVINEYDSGISIAGDWFHAYQIFTADDLTTYAVAEDFIAFFSGEKTGGDGKTYDFDTYLEAIETAKAAVDTTNGYADNTDAATKESAYDNDTGVQTALDDYNQLAGLYVESFQNDLYQLAVDLRTYIEHDASIGDYIKCEAHNVAIDSEADERVTLSGLTGGYYFVLDEESTLNGLGIAASGAFVPLGEGVSEHQTIYVKNSVPTVDKNIYHNDEDGVVHVPVTGSTTGENEAMTGKWDIVGDYEIGDTAYFLITSTLPSNIDEYNFDKADTNTVEDYTYILSDTMSVGITYNRDVKVYIDKDATTLLDSTYYTAVTVYNDDETVPIGFQITVNVKALKADEKYEAVGTLYTHYTGVVNENAAVSNGYEENTITLTFNNNPDDSSHTGTDTATVYSYTFDLEIDKIDENGAGLAGATFGLYDGDTWIPLNYLKTENGMDYYYLDPDMDTTGTYNGYVVTNADGKFSILGLDDAIVYVIKEESAPEGYNAIDPFSFMITATYNSTTGKIETLVDNSSSISNSGNQSGFEADIINRKEIFLPSTGGIGTVIFQVVGVVLMVGAVVFLLVSRKKKSRKES